MDDRHSVSGCSGGQSLSLAADRPPGLPVDLPAWETSPSGLRLPLFQKDKQQATHEAQVFGKLNLLGLTGLRIALLPERMAHDGCGNEHAKQDCGSQTRQPAQCQSRPSDHHCGPVQDNRPLRLGDSEAGYSRRTVPRVQESISAAFNEDEG